MLFANELGGGVGDTFSFQPHRLSAETFSKLEIGLERLFVFAAIFLEIHVHGVEFRIHAPGHTRGASQKILRAGIGADAHGDAFANGPILLDVFLIQIGREAAVDLFGYLPERELAQSDQDCRGGRNSSEPVRLSPCGRHRRASCDSGAPQE